MNAEATPSYEEFEKEVRAHFKGLSQTVSEEDANAYLDGDEAQGEIRNAYDQNVKQFEAGEITREVFMVGGVSSVGYCLYMMY